LKPIEPQRRKEREGRKGEKEERSILFALFAVLRAFAVLPGLSVNGGMMWIEWRIWWRGDEAAVRWEDGALVSENGATAAFGRFAVSGAPRTDRPLEERLRDPAIADEMMTEFADAVLETRRSADVS
jgi:hypothetical protein